MSALNGHKFIVIGDSYTVGITGGGGTIDSWLDYFVSWYGSEWDGYFESAIGGYGFAKTDYQFLTLLNALDNTISDKASITDILVVGGYNDHGYLSGVQAAIAEFKAVANQKYPNAKLWIAPVGWTTNQYQADVITSINYYIQYGNLYGYRVLEEMKNVMRSNPAYLSSDDIHPTEAGYKALAQYMHTYLLEYLTAPRIMYNGQDKWKIKATGLLNEGSGGGGGGGLVDDVQVNGTSVVTNKVANIDLTPYAETSDLATVATSGSYNDLSNKPTIPAAQVNSDWNASSGVAEILNKPNLATVATSGSYNDLSNKPTIPSTASDVGAYTTSEVDTLLNGKQGILTAGTNITIDANNEISATDTTYTAGTGINIDANNVISATGGGGTTYTFAEGSTNGAFSVTPSGGSAQSVPIHGLGSAAYTSDDDYVKTASQYLSAATQATVRDNIGLSIIDANENLGIATKGGDNILQAVELDHDGNMCVSVPVTNESATLDWGTLKTIATVAGKSIDVSLPSNPASGKVSKSGDTMTGNLTVSRSGEALVQTKNTQWTLTTASNNGITANTSAGAFYHIGSDNTMIGRTNCYGGSDGAVSIVLQVYNKKTNGSSVNNAISAIIKKDGSQTYSVSNATNFRSAIGAAASSSRAYKENIEEMSEEEARKILDIEVCSYDYKEGFGEKGQFGVIAEDVLDKIPYAVNIPENYNEQNVRPEEGTTQELITIDYWKFIPHLIKTVQMQQREIEELKAEIKAIKEGH